MKSCPKCDEKLGRWKFRIVHDLFVGWFYKCDCGYESRKVENEKVLEKIK
jgi:hypothetical protein